MTSEDIRAIEADLDRIRDELDELENRPLDTVTNAAEWICAMNDLQRDMDKLEKLLEAA